MKHTNTPEEWEILRADRSEYNESIAKDMAGCLANGERILAYFPTASAMANARLISAAPDLLTALEDAEFLLRKAGLMAGPMRDSFNRSASDARAAIAKATGREEA
jgi:hypothetical protein